MQGTGAENAEPEGFYLDLCPAEGQAHVRGLPDGGVALAAEIAALRVLLRAVLADPKLGSVDRLIAFGRGADYLARVYRLRQQLNQAASQGGQADLDAALTSLGLL